MLWHSFHFYFFTHFLFVLIGCYHTRCWWRWAILDTHFSNFSLNRRLYLQITVGLILWNVLKSMSWNLVISKFLSLSMKRKSYSTWFVDFFCISIVLLLRVSLLPSTNNLLWSVLIGILIARHGSSINRLLSHVLLFDRFHLCPEERRHGHSFLTFAKFADLAGFALFHSARVDICSRLLWAVLGIPFWCLVHCLCHVWGLVADWEHGFVEFGHELLIYTFTWRGQAHVRCLIDWINRVLML